MAAPTHRIHIDPVGFRVLITLESKTRMVRTWFLSIEEVRKLGQTLVKTADMLESDKLPRSHFMDKPKEGAGL